MSDKLNEQVSALMDDECTEQELKLAVRQLTRDVILMAQWERYHLISDVLKGDAPAVMNVDFAERMRAVIDTEPPLAANAKPLQAPRPWAKPLAGFALAASVAAVAVFVMRPDVMQPNNPSLLAGDTEMAQTLELTRFDEETVDAEDDMLARMNAYMVNHNSMASMSSVYGVLPYVRMAGTRDGR